MGFDQLSMNAGSLSVIKRVLSAFSRDELSELMATLRPLRSAQEVVSALDHALGDRGLDIFLRRGICLVAGAPAKRPAPFAFKKRPGR